MDYASTRTSQLLRIGFVFLLSMALASFVGCQSASRENTGNLGEDEAPAFTEDTSDRAAEEPTNPEQPQAIPNFEVKITVKNACGVEGAAATAADILSELGYNPQVKNAQQWNYDETWIVYRDESFKAQAEEIVEALGTGRTLCTPSTKTGWDYEGDILVAVGLDWANQNMREEGQEPYTFDPGSNIIE